MLAEQDQDLDQIPLPIRCRARFSAPNSAAGQHTKIAAKSLIYTRFWRSNRRFSGLKRVLSLLAGEICLGR